MDTYHAVTNNLKKCLNIVLQQRGRHVVILQKLSLFKDGI